MAENTVVRSIQSKMIDISEAKPYQGAHLSYLPQLCLCHLCYKSTSLSFLVIHWDNFHYLSGISSESIHQIIVKYHN